MQQTRIWPVRAEAVFSADIDHAHRRRAVSGQDRRSRHAGHNGLYGLLDQKRAWLTKPDGVFHKAHVTTEPFPVER